MALRFRRGSESDRTNPSFVPEDGEPVWIVDTKRLYIGDGSTSGGVLVTGSSGSGSTPGIDDNTTGVVLTLDDAVATFTNDVELDSSDLILAGGAITGTGNINILGNITASGTLTGNIANIGSVNVTAGINAGAVVRAPFFDGDLTGSVFADDSTMLIDGVSQSITANFYSPLNGSLIISNVEGSGNRLEVFNISYDARPKIYYQSTLDGTVASRNDPFEQWAGLYFNCLDDDGTTTSAIINVGPSRFALGHDSTGIFSVSAFTYFQDGNLGIGVFPNEKLDVNGNAIISGSLTAGAVLLSGSNIDTSDSSVITVTPAVTFSSDVVIENSLTVANTLTVDTLAVTNFQTAGAGTPELSSDTDILLTAGTRVEITSSPIKMASFTNTERNLLSAQNGDIIYNSTDNKFQGYENGAWVNLV